MKTLTELGLSELIDGLRSKRFSSLELTQAYLDSINERDNDIHAYVTVTAEKAIDAAKRADKAISQGTASPMCGIPIAYKDNICTCGTKTTCASRMLSDHIPIYSADVVELLENAGAVMLGKLNMDEFAMGSTTESSAFFATKNPISEDRVPGGSSGGSAAAVAGRLAPCALGSDTGGSIRQPSAFCGAVGIKPTYGRVSRYGLIPLAPSLDQIGGITRTVKDNALLLDAISAPSQNDMTLLHPRGKDSFLHNIERGIKGLRIGLPREFFGDGIAPSVSRAVLDAVNTCRSLGAELTEVNLPSLDTVCDTYTVIASGEAASNLARFDGVRFGHRAKGDFETFEELYTRSRTEAFGSEVKRRIMLGTLSLSAEYKTQLYERAIAARMLITRELDTALSACDILLTPTTPRTAYRLGENANHPHGALPDDIFVIPASLAGLPALSLPCGHDRDGLPIGVQLIGKKLDEALMYRVAFSLESALNIKTKEQS